MRIVVTIRGGSVEDIFVARPAGAENMPIQAGVLDYDVTETSGGDRIRGEYTKMEVSSFDLLINQVWGDGTLQKLRKAGMITPQEDFYPTILSALQVDERCPIIPHFALIPISTSLAEDVLGAREVLSDLQGDNNAYTTVTLRDCTPLWVRKAPRELENFLWFSGRYAPTDNASQWVMCHLPQAFYEGIEAFTAVNYDENLASVYDVNVHVDEATFWWSGFIFDEKRRPWEVRTAAYQASLRDQGLCQRQGLPGEGP